MAKMDDLLTHIMDIKEDVAGIREHLNTLNSKVATNVLNIEKAHLQNSVTEEKVHKIDLKLARWGGIVTGVVVLVQLAFKLV